MTVLTYCANSSLGAQIDPKFLANAASSDVRAWSAQLARKLRASTADVPEAARIQANTLLEKLWALAQGSSATPLPYLRYREHIPPL